MSDRAVFLLVEDNESDVILIQRAFVTAKVLNPLVIVNSSEDAMAYLAGAGRYTNRDEFPLPSLILLDLKLPGLDGFDFLRWLRQQPGIQSTRVVVLSSSDHVRDIDRAYKVGANSFLVKPVDFERFVEVSLALSGYWIWLDRPPDVSRPPQVSPTSGESLTGSALTGLLPTPPVLPNSL